LTFTFSSPKVLAVEKVKVMKLTKRQKEILDFIAEFIQREGYSPSMEEIASHFRFASLNAVFKHLASLEARGHLRRDARRARSIELSTSRSSAVQVLPFLGYVSAGRPIEAVSNSESLRIPDDLVAGLGPYYVLRVQGESMIDDHIADGDYVIVESREEAHNGEMVVALIDGENVTLKRFYKEGTNVRLQPANPDLDPLVVEAGRVKIQGIVAAIMRKYR
jgi:repressor LexA